MKVTLSTCKTKIFSQDLLNFIKQFVASPVSNVKGKCKHKTCKAAIQESKFAYAYTNPSIDKHYY